MATAMACGGPLRLARGVAHGSCWLAAVLALAVRISRRFHARPIPLQRHAYFQQTNKNTIRVFNFTFLDLRERVIK